MLDLSEPFCNAGVIKNAQAKASRSLAATRQLALEFNETRTCDLRHGRAEQISSLPVFFFCYTGFPSTINIIIYGYKNVKK